MSRAKSPSFNDDDLPLSLPPSPAGARGISFNRTTEADMPGESPASYDRGLAARYTPLPPVPANASSALGISRRTILLILLGGLAVGGGAIYITSIDSAQSNQAPASPVTTQDNWRWCNKCTGLFFAGNATLGVCPAGGTHNLTGSGDYHLIDNTPSDPGQHDWRWCNKCAGLFFAGNATLGICATGGMHDPIGSGDYSLSGNGSGQHDWRWCNKCAGLFFAGNATLGACPAGGTHDLTGSGDYVLMGTKILPSGPQSSSHGITTPELPSRWRRVHSYLRLRLSFQTENVGVRFQAGAEWRGTPR